MRKRREKEKEKCALNDGPIKRMERLIGGTRPWLFGPEEKSLTVSTRWPKGPYQRPRNLSVKNKDG